MNFWKLEMVNSVTGNRDLNDPVFLVCTTGGTSKAEIARQIDDAKEMVLVSHQGPPSHEMEGKELSIEIVEFDQLGVTRIE